MAKPETVGKPKPTLVVINECQFPHPEPGDPPDIRALHMFYRGVSGRLEHLSRIAQSIQKLAYYPLPRKENLAKEKQFRDELAKLAKPWCPDELARSILEFHCLVRLDAKLPRVPCFQLKGSSAHQVAPALLTSAVQCWDLGQHEARRRAAGLSLAREKTCSQLFVGNWLGPVLGSFQDLYAELQTEYSLAVSEVRRLQPPAASEAPETPGSNPSLTNQVTVKFDVNVSSALKDRRNRQAREQRRRSGGERPAPNSAKETAASVPDTCKDVTAQKPSSEARAEPKQPPQSSPENLFQRQGCGWLLRFAGKQIYMKNLKGLEYIAKLIQRPYEELSIADLAAPGIVGQALASERATPVADDEAIKAARAQAKEFEIDIAKAQRDHNLSVLDQLHHKRDAVNEQLRGMVNVKGKSRSHPNGSDRLRRSIGRAIERAIPRVRNHHAALGNHLDSSIDTGWVNVYKPAGKMTWTVI